LTTRLPNELYVIYFLMLEDAIYETVKPDI
jgi:hypothetical protein